MSRIMESGGAIGTSPKTTEKKQYSEKTNFSYTIEAFVHGKDTSEHGFLLDVKKAPDGPRK